MVEILRLFAEKGFLLDKELFGILSGMDEEKVLEVVNKLVNKEIDKGLINKSVFEKNGILLEGKVRVDENSVVKLLSMPRFLPRKIEVRDFIQHFRSRFEILKKVFENKVGELSSIRRIGRNDGVYNIVAMVTKKRMTKNKNLLIEVEDLTGESVVLVNRDKKDLFKKAESLMLDDVVVFKVSGSSNMLFVSDIVFSDLGLEKEKFGEVDEYIAFSGDFHVGSRNFLEDDVLKFVDWLNGEVGDERQRALALKVKYLILTGDMVDGVGVFGGQDKWLNIKDIRGQYKRVGEILKRIRDDVEIVMCSGQHDAVWVGEPQPIIAERWAGSLYKMKNLKLVSNPALVDIRGFKVLIYHGASINRFIDEMNDIRVEFGHLAPTRVVREMLRRGHLSPTHGLMDYIPCEVDPMVIRDAPDIIATGDQHRAEVSSYNNILMVASSCWQSLTPFEEKMGDVPEPCRVPLFNLKTREIKIIDFSDKSVKWKEGDDLVCELGVRDENSD